MRRFWILALAVLCVSWSPRRHWIPRDAVSVVCVADYDAANLPAGAVASWPDSSGKGHPLVQATGSKQPVASATDAQIGNRPSVLFDGSNDTLAATFTLAQPFTVLFVWENVTVGASGVNDVCWDGVTGVTAMLCDNTQTVVFAGAAMANPRVEANGVYAYGTFVVNGASSVIRTGGTQRSATNAGANAAGGITLGTLSNGTRAVNIKVARMIVFSGALAGAELLAAEDYLKRQYSL